MTDKEILAELKKSYEYLQDMIDNADQLSREEIQDLITAENLLIDIYSNLWKKTEEDIKIENENDLTIGKEIYSDYYEVGNDEFISKANVLKNGKEYEWWNDYEFLLKIGGIMEAKCQYCGRKLSDKKKSKRAKYCDKNCKAKAFYHKKNPSAVTYNTNKTEEQKRQEHNKYCREYYKNNAEYREKHKQRRRERYKLTGK